MYTSMLPGEKSVKVGPATLQKNIESVGGELTLTNRRLIFESHHLNIQRGVTEIQLSDVQSARKCFTRFLGVIPIFPNSLAVLTKQGQEHRFVLLGRRQWADAIEEARGVQQADAS